MSQKDFLFAIVSTFVILSSIFTANSEIPVKAMDAETNSPARAPEKKVSSRYFGLRSCHQVLRGESGEFFSPDFLCSNPPLWCNWTIAAPPGRRIRLHLDDYTPADSCHLKRGEIHLDESPGSGRHRTLRQCWRSAVYTSDSSTLHVVLLINGSQEPAYRGFRARYQAFGLPHDAPPPPPPSSSPSPSPTRANNMNWGVEMEETVFTVGEEEEKPATEQPQMDDDPALRNSADPTSLKGGSVSKSPSPEQPLRSTSAERASSDAPPPQSGESDPRAGEAEDSGLTKEGATQPKRDSEDSGLTKEGATQPKRDSEDSSDDVSDGPSKGEPSRDALADAEGEEDLGSVDPPVTPPPPRVAGSPTEISSSAPSSELWEEEPDYDASETGSRSTRKLREDWDEDTGPGRPAVTGDSDPPSGTVERQGTEISRRGGSVKPSGTPPAPEDSLRESADSARYLRNTSTLASLPGDNLFEVSVEVRLALEGNENWDHLVRLVMSSVQTMIQDELRAHVVPKSISSKRIKRLSGGVLYIFWLQFGDGLESLQVHRFLLMALPRLQTRAVNTRGRKDPASITLVSSEDVNECGTQVVLCDVNAECINRFGSYACRCHPGFEDRSRLGSGGTACVAPAGTGPSQSQPPSSSSPGLLNCLYGLCFLLGFFVVLLLCIVGAQYRRHHRGAFMVPCHGHENGGSSSSGGGGGGGDGDGGAARNGSRLPPPPPPVRRPRDGWSDPKDKCPSTDLPLLKFAPLAPNGDGTQHQEQEEGDKL
ncbi:uncharacterized protein zgc:66455 isoform X2 [Anguilla anguilla]|uniref:uncharacterized protein zgc:66455 isoform X2 n=1 Tax=Anguilla anguilla TaxID=7936 RepID=UPI0015AEE924|nr:uncharacterized protein zgc:66455 isoform X2 [Anguilla anguilla]